jgi:hypothetical protein
VQSFFIASSFVLHVVSNYAQQDFMTDVTMELHAVNKELPWNETDLVWNETELPWNEQSTFGAKQDLLRGERTIHTHACPMPQVRQTVMFHP